MIQEIITYILIFLAFGYTLYGIAMIFVPQKSKGGHCASGCSSCSARGGEPVHSFKKIKVS
ncbi:MAG: hypothetical protein U9N85_09745 [Bacteroidota bacterium]|nr:hypothetical protein [Bacteroidota bacterium]